MPRLLEISGRWLIASIFIYAAVPKLFDLDSFAATVAAYAILPDSLIEPAALLLPVLEIIIAIGMIAGNRFCCVCGICLLLLFVVILTYAIYMGFDIDCGCFGPEDPEHTAFKGLRAALGRDLLMLLPLFYSLWFQYFRRPEKYELQKR